MIHVIPENWQATPAKPNWRKNCGVALLAGGLTGLLFWCLTGHFSSAFTITTGLVLSSMWADSISSPYAHASRAGNWLEHSCTHWRSTRRGILIYCHQKPMPCLFLPWESLHTARPCKNGITLEDATNDTFYELPVAESQQTECLARIQECIRLHHTGSQQDETVCKPVYYLMSPHLLPTWKHLKYPLPWVALGLLCPFFWPGEIIPCVLSFALAGSIGSMTLTDFEDDWGTETYMGEEIRRSKRGVSLCMNGGARCFIPWSSLTEGTQLEDQHAFLQLQGSTFGIILAATNGSIPIPLTRLFLKRHRLVRKLGRLAITFLFLAAGVLWFCWWY